MPRTLHPILKYCTIVILNFDDWDFLRIFIWLDGSWLNIYGQSWFFVVKKKVYKVRNVMTPLQSVYLGYCG